MYIDFGDPTRMPGQGCYCGGDCNENRHMRSRLRSSADRTRSYRQRAGSRRWKRLAAARRERSN